MKIIFFGSSDFGVPILRALNKKESLCLVITQPDRKKGRALKIVPTPVKKAAEDLGLKIFQPVDVNCRESIEYLKKFDVELFIVVGFGQILSKELLDIPKLSLNVHASLLPKYRGAAPINWALLNSEKETGITIIRMNQNLDEGDILLKERVCIDSDEDAIALSKRLSQKAAELILHSIDLIEKKEARFTKQANFSATYAPKLKKEDGLIDWRSSADKIYNKVRAFVPWPGCFTYWDGKTLKIWKARPGRKILSKDSKPGEVVEIAKKSILVSTGKGTLEIEELQLEGKRRMKVEDFLIGHKDMKPDVVFQMRPSVSGGYGRI